jgi:hypothetical protein
MFDTYFDDSMRFTGIMTEHPMVLATTVAINVLSLLLSLSAILYLDLSWVDVGYGVLATMGIGILFGAVIGLTSAVSPRFVCWTMSHPGLGIALGTLGVVLYTTLGFSLFIGLPAALAVVVLPAIITTPVFVSLRRWALRTY